MGYSSLVDKTSIRMFFRNFQKKRPESFIASTLAPTSWKVEIQLG